MTNQATRKEKKGKAKKEGDKGGEKGRLKVGLGKSRAEKRECNRGASGG